MQKSQSFPFFQLPDIEIEIESEIETCTEDTP